MRVGFGCARALPLSDASFESVRALLMSDVSFGYARALPLSDEIFGCFHELPLSDVSFNVFLFICDLNVNARCCCDLWVAVDRPETCVHTFQKYKTHVVALIACRCCHFMMSIGWIH